ncbi:hypothetical protein vseg_000280 [Gypsophila vaccaria]
MENKRTFLSKRASFLKIVDRDFSKLVTLPRAFIKHFNGDLPQWFILEIAGTRKGWRVDTKENTSGGFFLSYGWSQFVDEQSLHVGDFLLFEYEEPLILQVKIFDKDGTEKPAATNLEFDHEVDQIPKAHCVADDDLWTIRPTAGYDRDEKFQEDIDGVEMETADQCGIHERPHAVISGVEMETGYCYGIHEKHDIDIDDMAAVSDDQCRVRGKQLEMLDRIDRGMGKVFVTEQGVCYSIIWRKVHHLYYYLTFPRALVVRRKLSIDETVILKSQDGSTWPMKLRERPGGRVDIAQGWKEFLIENDVRNGDILTFVLSSDKVIHVRIDRSSEIDRPSEMAYKSEPLVSSDSICEEPVVNHTTPNLNVWETTRGNVERVFVNDFTCSSFSVTWKHSSKSSYLHIPKAIATKQKLKDQDTVVLFDPEGNRWQMKIRTRPSDGRVGISQGWNAFWKRYKISSGDTLIFEFVSDHVMNVNINRGHRVLPVRSSSSVEPAMKQEVMQLN